MKLPLLLLALFFASFALQSQSRELTATEALLLKTQGREDSVKIIESMTSSIDEENLSFTQRLNFKRLQNSCYLMNALLGRIDESDDQFADQSKVLLPLAVNCSNGARKITLMYIGQKELE